MFMQLLSTDLPITNLELPDINFIREVLYHTTLEDGLDTNIKTTIHTINEDDVSEDDDKIH